MALGTDYANQVCTMARSLEIVGERWTLLIVRAAFYGVRRFSDFADRVGAPRALLAERLAKLVAEGIFERDGEGRMAGYALSDKGRDLWPVVASLTSWGDRYYPPEVAPAELVHVSDNGVIDGDGRCSVCAVVPAVEELQLAAREPA
ncbi:winged helix-turn-helix transcriptional regulator [Rhodococcus erythropolis]|jgi:DNA-binding HxlR family transcriptional regulator|uniref:winged helix-turn-helix transcriptional regulator n=1 Tax=Rhodococcus erythropolis TaxID=1833 RepID=UPI000374B92C|nr:helix-turn-helix domain-containing protein [Rhodococcus erythropolis]